MILKVFVKNLEKLIVELKNNNISQSSINCLKLSEKFNLYKIEIVESDNFLGDILLKSENIKTIIV